MRRFNEISLQNNLQTILKEYISRFIPWMLRITIIVSVNCKSEGHNDRNNVIFPIRYGNQVVWLKIQVCISVVFHAPPRNMSPFIKKQRIRSFLDNQCS